jgi:hypothetical protein
MGNIHNSVEVVSLVPQGDIMPFHHYPTIGLVVLVVPKSLLVNHFRNGLGTIFALSDQHVQPGYFLVFAIKFFFKGMVSLESIYINI